MQDPENNIEFEKQLDAYLKGELTTEQVDRLWISFMKHPEYFEQFETELALVKLMQEKGNTAREPKTSILFTRYKLGGIAAAVLLFLGLWWGFGQMQSVDSGDLVSNKIAVAQLESAYVERSSVDDGQAAKSRLNAGLEAALSGRSGEALDIFNSLAQSTQPSVRLRASFNRGIMLYNNASYTEAVEAFDVVIQYQSNLEQDSSALNMLVGKALWYKSHALLKLDQTSAAKGELNRVVKMGGSFENEARQLLNKMES